MTNQLIITSPLTAEIIITANIILVLKFDGEDLLAVCKRNLCSINVHSKEYAELGSRSYMFEEMCNEFASKVTKKFGVELSKSFLSELIIWLRIRDMNPMAI